LLGKALGPLSVNVRDRTHPSELRGLQVAANMSSGDVAGSDDSNSEQCVVDHEESIDPFRLILRPPPAGLSTPEW
jgi:hypothetical protein